MVYITYEKKETAFRIFRQTLTNIKNYMDFQQENDLNCFNII